MQKRTVTITNRLGLHARAAARSDALHNTADSKSIFSVLLLAATQNTLIEITVEGPDEELAMETLCRLIADKFGEE